MNLVVYWIYLVINAFQNDRIKIKDRFFFSLLLVQWILNHWPYIYCLIQLWRHLDLCCILLLFHLNNIRYRKNLLGLNQVDVTLFLFNWCFIYYYPFYDKFWLTQCGWAGDILLFIPDFICYAPEFPHYTVVYEICFFYLLLINIFSIPWFNFPHEIILNGVLLTTLSSGRDFVGG